MRGQALLSLIIGASAGLGMYVLGVTGLLPHAQNYALVFGAWVALTEVLPVPRAVARRDPAARSTRSSCIRPRCSGSRCSSSAIHQIEGHIVVPNVMGSALRLHPLLVIFGLLVGFEVDGLVGALIALPLLAAAGATWEFFAERIVLESWPGGGMVPVEIEPVAIEPVEPAEPSRPVAVDG